MSEITHSLTHYSYCNTFITFLVQLWTFVAHWGVQTLHFQSDLWPGLKDADCASSAIVFMGVMKRLKTCFMMCLWPSRLTWWQSEWFQHKRICWVCWLHERRTCRWWRTPQRISCSESPAELCGGGQENISKPKTPSNKKHWQHVIYINMGGIP